MEKISKAEADYHEWQVRVMPCNRCSMYVTGPVAAGRGSCTLVRGSIAPLGHCKFWEKLTTPGKVPDSPGNDG